MSDRKLDLNIVPWESPINGLRFKRYIQKSHNQQIRLVEFSKGFVEPNWCEKAHLGFVLQGEFQIIFDSEVVFYKQGDVISIIEGKEHRHKISVLSNTVELILFEKEQLEDKKYG